MSPIFCYSSIAPYREARLTHEGKFLRFMAWARHSESSSPVTGSDSYFRNPNNNIPEFAVQFVQQVNYGPVEAKRYFIPDTSLAAGGPSEFLEVTEQDLIIGNFQKLNALVCLSNDLPISMLQNEKLNSKRYKNFKCVAHNKFFELNIYQKDPLNQHHWRVNIARPGSDIDI